MSNRPDYPVFFDPDQKRWPRFRRGLFVAAFVFSVLAGVLILSVLINPVLPALDLPSAAMLPHAGHLAPPRAEPVLPSSPKSLRLAKQRLEIERRRSRARVQPARPAPAPGGPPMSAAFFVNWDDSSFNSLKENLGNLDLVVPEWLHLASSDGSLSEDNARREAQVRDYIRQRRPDLRIMPLVNNFNGHDWEGDKLGTVLRNPAARARVAQQALAFVQRGRYAGISLDFENIPKADYRLFLDLVEEVADVFHAARLAVSVNVAPDDAALDYARLADSADYVILMAYDEHWPGGSPGPIAAIDWFSATLNRRLRDIPRDRVIVALGNYGYDWGGGPTAEEKTFEEAVLTARESDGRIGFDPVALNAGFRYEDDAGKVHQVWMLDAAAAFNQARVATDAGVRGLALWRLGSEDPALWRFFGKNLPFNSQTAQQLSAMRYGYDLDYEGKGEIIQITSRPAPGHRTITFDPARQAITDERFDVFPSPYVLTRYGAVDHAVALTFDDGPDPYYTPAILDVLQDEKVPATFFIIGVNGEEYPWLLRREVAEGHEVGNHTFTHPNIANIPHAQMRFELSATQRLFESVLGVQSHLFRSPYAEDAEPETADQVRPLEQVVARGYLMVGMRVDPGDWQRPGVNEIVRRTVAQVEAGDGNVILLHDAGGDRSETVDALPLIIRELRARGYRFVLVSDLLGRTRAQVMPPIGPGEWWQARLDGLAFGALNAGIVALRWLFIVGIVLGVARLVFVGALAILQRWRQRRRVMVPGYDPSVAVIVPAFNEENVIVQTVRSLLASSHPSSFEIIVVNDGSTDGTAERLLDVFGDEPRVKVFTKANGGKAAALNFGVARTNADIVVALDADTVFARDTITKLVRHFADPRVGAVAGNARVGNRVNLLTRWQALEYVTSQNLDRRAFDVLNCITVVPGAVGAWRRELVEQASGFSPMTLAEDADLTLSILEQGYRVVYEEEAIALTEAPDTVKAFVKQRYRWMYGTFQAAWKHRGALLRPSRGALGLVALPNIFVFQVLFPLVSPVMDLVMALTLITTAADWWQHPAEFNGDTLSTVLFYYALFVAVDLLAALTAFFLERKENARLIVLLFWQRFFYRQLMYYVAIRALVSSLRGGEVGWGKLERKATVRV